MSRLDEILNKHAQEFKAGHLGKVKQAILAHLKAQPELRHQEGLDNKIDYRLVIAMLERELGGVHDAL